MGKPYSDDLRERVVAAIEAGHTRVKVAERYNMALSTVGGVIKRKRETGSISPDKFGGYKTFTLEPHTDRVKELVAEQPDSTLAELQVRLAKEKVKVRQSGISRFLHHISRVTSSLCLFCGLGLAQVVGNPALGKSVKLLELCRGV